MALFCLFSTLITKIEEEFPERKRVSFQISLERIVHIAYRLELKGESMKRGKSNLTHSGQ